MAWDLKASRKESNMQGTLSDIDSGAGAGYLAVLDNGDTDLMHFTLADPAGVVSGDTLTFDIPTPITGSYIATGVIAKGELRNSNGEVEATTVSVGTSNSDILVSSTQISDTIDTTLLQGVMKHG